MKTKVSLLSLLAASAAAFFASTDLTPAQFFARDDAAGYTNTVGGNFAWMYQTTTNGGFGLNPWVFRNTANNGTSFSGFFVGTGDAIASASNTSWGMYANGSSGTNVAVAYRSFTNSLQTNTVFKIKWHTKGISASNPNALGGFNLRNGNANASTNDFNTGYRFAFFYQGAGVDSFQVADASGLITGIGFGSNPFLIEFTLLTADTYRLVIKDATGANTITNFDNRSLAGSGTIDSLALYALQTEGDQIFNNIEISSTSLIPPDIQNVSPANGSIYVDTTNKISFDVLSAFSTLASNGISLSVNGVGQTNLAVTGFPTNRHVVLNTALAANLVYNGTIIAQDANGNKATNIFTFNTWTTNNPYIEAEDYNYSSGFSIDNFANIPPQDHNLYAGLLGSNGIDYLEYDLSGTNNAWRTGDLPQTEVTTDADHNGFTANGFQDYNLSFIENGEWQNYTRRMSNATYDVYARMAGFGNSATMLMEHLANSTATSSNQPRAALGTFVCPNTGGAQNWTFVQLKDFFSNPVQVHFSGTHTFKNTCLGADGNYNVTYLIFVPNTNANTLRPYVSSGFPFPGVGGVFPDQAISFTIANRQSSVTPGSIQLLLNSNNVTSGIVLSNNAAGTLVTYQSPTLLPAGTNTAQAIYSDGSVSQTNTWQFTVATLPVIPAAYAVNPSQAGSPGFAIQIAKAADSATATDFPPTIARAYAHLAGIITNAATLAPYVNIAAGPNNDGLFNETSTINYDINAAASGNSTFNFKTNFPYVPASGTNNFISLAANMYVQLSAGVHTFSVRSDDGFILTTGPTPTSTNLTLGEFDAGRGDNTPTTFSFIVQTNGLYPMRLVYDQGEFGGSIELYSIQSGQSILLNDSTNANAVKVYRTLASAGIVLLNPAHSGNTTTFSFQTQNGTNYSVKFKKTLNDVSWLTLQNVLGNGSITNITDNTATNPSRFYSIRP
jgi:hypothetical protein